MKKICLLGMEKKHQELVELLQYSSSILTDALVTTPKQSNREQGKVLTGQISRNFYLRRGNINKILYIKECHLVYKDLAGYGRSLSDFLGGSCP
jgi:hypothetical protein